MQQALEALESCTPGDTTTVHVIWPSYDEMIAQARKSNVEAAITALQERLAQPEGKRRHGEADEECDREEDAEKATIHSKANLKTGLFVYDYVYVYENGKR